MPSVQILKKLLLTAILLYGTIGAAQTLDSLYVKQMNDSVMGLRYNGKFKQAYKVSNQLIEALESNNSNPDLLAPSYFMRSRIEIELGQYDDAYQNFNKAFGIYQQLGDSLGLAKVYNIRGVYHYYQNNMDSTIYNYQKSYEIKKIKKFASEELAISAYNIAIVYEDTGLHEQAMKLYREAEEALLNYKEEKSFLADVYIGIAHIYKYSNDFANAEKYAEKAWYVGLATYGEFNPNMTFVYTSYANILRVKKKYKEAIELAKKILKIRQDNYGEIHRWTSESHNLLGELYGLDGQTELALEQFNQAIVIGEQLDGALYLAYSQQALANFYVANELEFDQAEILLNKALKTYQEVLGIKNELVAEGYNALAEIDLFKNVKKQFFNHINLAKEASGFHANQVNLTEAPIQALEMLIIKSNWYAKQYEQTNDIKFLLKKFDLIDVQVAMIKHLQSSFSTQVSKISFANNYRIVFEEALNNCWALYHKTDKDIKYLEKAFELSETNRNTSLLEGLQDLKFKGYSDIPETLLKLELEIKQKLTKAKMDLYYEKNGANPDKQVLNQLVHDRITWSNKLDSLHGVFDSTYPKYNNLKYNGREITLKDIQASLSEDSQAVTYFLGEKNLFSFTITKDDVQLLRGNVAEELVKGISKIKSAIVEQNQIDEVSKDLFLFLINQQVNQDKTKLLIIPDHVLNYIPFEILKNSEGEYLIEKFEISYSGSARLYLELKEDYFNYDSSKNWIGFSPSFKGDQALSGNDEEVTSISKIINGKPLVGKASRKDNFYKNLEDYSIVHLATHASIDNENPLYNKLHFSDGDLTSAEIYNARIFANLAVLSACNTGFGKLEKGEGVMSMARAFNFAGVPSVVMSLWKVPDKETQQIMISFYEHLKSGKSKSDALRLAKLDYLKNTNDVNLKHPYYWSGFVLNGNTSAIELRQKKYLYGGGIILLLGLLAFVALKRRG